MAFLFNKIASDTIRITKNGRRANRISNFKGLVFSNRSIEVEESFSFRIVETKSFTGTLRFGVTYISPKTFEGSMPRVYDTIFNKNGPFETFQSIEFQVVNLPKSDCCPGKKFRFTFNRSGDINFEVDETEREALMHIDTGRTFWIIIDIYGVVSAIELTDEYINEPVAGAVFVSPSNPKAINPTKSDDDGLCVVCFENSLEVAFVSCGHICACYNCALTIWRNTSCCPICNSSIKDVMRVKQ